MKNLNVISVFNGDLEQLLSSSQQFSEWHNISIHGDETTSARVKHDAGNSCKICGAKNGQYHITGCKNELCPDCDHRLSICNCSIGRDVSKSSCTNPDHRKIYLEGNRMSVGVDAEIAPLVSEIWKVGIDTLHSCQGYYDENMIGLEFPITEMATDFLDIVTRHEKEKNSMYSRVTGGSMYSEKDVKDIWDYALIPRDVARVRDYYENSTNDSYYDETVSFVFSILLIFPMRDYPVIFKRLLDHNSKSKK